MKKHLRMIKILCKIYILTDVLLWAGYKWAGLALSDTVIRIMGIGTLITLPTLAYICVKYQSPQK